MLYDYETEEGLCGTMIYGAGRMESPELRLSLSGADGFCFWDGQARVGRASEFAWSRFWGTTRIWRIGRNDWERYIE